MNKENPSLGDDGKEMELYGTTQAWANKFNVPIKEMSERLQTVTGILALNPRKRTELSYAESDVRAAIKDILQLRTPKDATVVREQLRQILPTPNDILFNLVVTHRGKSSCLKRLGFKRWIDVARIFGINENPWRSYNARLH